MSPDSGPSHVPRFSAIAVLRSSPRLLPEARRETGKQMWRIMRVTLLCGPLLAVLAWWWLRDLSPDHAPLSLLLCLLGASLCVPVLMGACCYIPLFFPRIGRFLLPEWKIWPKGLMIAPSLLAPWRDLSDFRVEPTPASLPQSEIVIHLTHSARGRTTPLSLTCVTSEIPYQLIEKLARAIDEKQWPV